MPALHLFVEAAEKIFSQRTCGTVDQALAQLGHLATDRGIDAVGQLAPAGLRRQADLRTALAKARRPTLAFEADAVAAGRHDVAEADMPLELGRHRTDAQRHADVVFIVGRGLDLVAAGNAQLEDLGVIQGLPGLLLCHAQGAGGLHLHDRSSSAHRNKKRVPILLQLRPLGLLQERKSLARLSARSRKRLKL